MNYQIGSVSHKGNKKEKREKNGDYCSSLTTDKCVVLALADGVGSCVDDARASKTTCDLFIKKCKTAIDNNVFLDRAKLDSYCREIDPILAIDGDMACFCAVVWYLDRDEVVFFHVGDTRIYTYSVQNGLKQMTSDDHGKAVNLKVGGKLYTDHGAVVSATPIDKAIGDRSFDYHTGTFLFVEGESIILCSDGLYGSSSFDEDIIFALSQVGLEESIGQLTTIAVQVQKQLPEGEARDNYYMLCNLLKDLLRIVFMRK